MSKDYIKLIDQIKASDDFVENTLKTLIEVERERREK